MGDEAKVVLPLPFRATRFPRRSCEFARIPCAELSGEEAESGRPSTRGITCLWAVPVPAMVVPVYQASRVQSLVHE